MPGVLHADMLAHLHQPAAELHWVLELDIDGETVRLGFGVASKSLGNYPPWLISMSEVRRTLSHWRGGLETPTPSVEIDDTGGQFTRLYGPRQRLRGVPARFRMLGPERKANGEPFPPAAHLTYFEGVVDSPSKTGNVLSLGLRFADDRYAADVPKSVVTKYVYTSLPGDTDLKGTAIPYLLGDHDSTGLDALGMVKCRYIGSPAANRFQYEVCGGWWQAVVRLLSDNVEVAIPTECEILQTVTGDSRQVTIAEFKVDQEDKEVLADLQDLGAALGPAARLRQALADLVHGDYHGAHLDPAGAGVDVDSFADLDVFLADRLGLTSSIAVGADRLKGKSIVDAFGVSFDVQFYWRYDGKLAARPWGLSAQNDLAFAGPGAPDSVLAQRQVLSSNLFLSEPSFSIDPESAITRILGKAGLRPADESFVNSRSVVTELNATMERSREAELRCLPPTAESVGNLEYMIATGSSGISGFSATGAASIEAAVSQGPPPGPASDAIRAQSATKTSLGGGTAQFDVPLSDVPELVAGQTLTIYLTGRGPGHDSGDVDTIDVSLVLSATPYLVGTITGISLTQHRYAIGVLPLSPATGLPFTRSELNGASLRVKWDSAGAVAGTKRVDVHQVYGAWAYTAAANVSPALLAILSRLANRYRYPPERMTVLAPLRFADFELGDDIPLEDEREGWGGKPWSRGSGRAVSMAIGPGLGGIEIETEDVKDQQTTLWLLGRSLAGVDGSSAAGDGMALIVPGNTVHVARASPKYLDAPAGIGVQSAGPLARVLDNCWSSDRYGTLIERTRKNWLVRSSFKSGTTDIVQNPGSGTIEIDKTVGEQLFIDPIVTDGHLLLTASPTSHATETRAAWPTVDSIGSPTVATPGVISIYYRGTGCAFRYVRAADGFYLNNATGLFQVGAVDNTLPDSDSWTKFESSIFSIVAAKARTYDLSVSLPAGGTLGRTLRVGHGQVEEGQWASSPILTDAATATRAADQISIDNDKSDGVSTLYVIPNDRGAVRYHTRVNWSSANVTAGTVFQAKTLRYDSNNAWVLGYVVGSGWIFQARSGGVNYSATVNVAVEADVEYQIDTRWTSSLLGGEWGKPLTLTLIVRRVSDGVVLGSAETTYVKPVFAAAASVGLGHDTSVAERQLDGYFIEVREEPVPPSDAALLAKKFKLAEAA